MRGEGLDVGGDGDGVVDGLGALKLHVLIEVRVRNDFKRESDCGIQHYHAGKLNSAFDKNLYIGLVNLQACNRWGVGG